MYTHSHIMYLSATIINMYKFLQFWKIADLVSIDFEILIWFLAKNGLFAKIVKLNTHNQ